MKATDESLTLPLAGEITAATVETCEEFLRSLWSQAKDAKKLTLDLGNVSFIDSSGLGFLIKSAQARQTAPGRHAPHREPVPERA